MIRGGALSLMIVACATTPVIGPVKLEVPVVATPVAPRLAERLAARAVVHDDYARSVLYTWTTAAQIAALRVDRRLLVAEANAGAGPSAYVLGLTRVVHTRSEGHELAGLLLAHEGLKRRRYAWTSPLATTMGLGPVRYGDALVRVELDARAVIIKFRPGVHEPFAAVDVNGNVVTIDELIAEPSRIAAVYHVRDGAGEAVAFREVVLCNEARVAAWSIATPEIRAQVDDDIDVLEQLERSALAWLPAAAVRESPVGAWATSIDAGLLGGWRAMLAFANDRYRPTRANFAAIAAAMRGYDGSGPPLVVVPAAVFPDQSAQSAQAAR